MDSQRIQGMRLLPTELQDPRPDGSVAGIPLLNSSGLVKEVKNLQSSMQQYGMCESQAHILGAAISITRYQKHNLQSRAAWQTNPGILR